MMKLKNTYKKSKFAVSLIIFSTIALFTPGCGEELKGEVGKPINDISHSNIPTPTPTSTPTPIPPLDEAVAEYNFDKNIDFLEDISGHGHNGTLNGAYIKDGVLNLDNETQTASIPDADEFELKNDFTIYVDIMVQDSALNYIIHKRNGNEPGWKLILNIEGRLSFYSNCVKDGYFFDPAVFPTNKWVHVKLVADRLYNKISLYRDGIKVAETEYLTDCNAENDVDVKIGGSENSNLKVDNLAFYNCAEEYVE